MAVSITVPLRSSSASSICVGKTFMLIAPTVFAPIAEALLGKKEGQEVEVHVPAGILKLKIEHISM